MGLFSHWSPQTFFKNTSKTLNASGNFITGLTTPIKKELHLENVPDPSIIFKTAGSVTGAVAGLLPEPDVAPTKEFGEGRGNLPTSKFENIAELGTAVVTPEQVKQAGTSGRAIGETIAGGIRKVKGGF